MPLFNTGENTLHYYEYGSGTQLLLAFHGFGMRGTQFKVFEESLGKKYKIISFDLFFHGETQINDHSVDAVRKGLQSKLFAQQISKFLAVNYPDVAKVSLLAYSIGTRMALCLIESIPEKLAQIYLIAPDGIEPNKLLKLGGSNFIINRFFYKLVYSPKTVFFLLNTLLKLSYIDDSIYRILKAEFGTTETRLACYNTITYYAQLSFDRKVIANHINKHNLNCHLYFGKKDKLFPSSIGERFGKLLNEPNLHIFDEGHELVNATMNSYLANQLKKNDN
ncbi:alpha/beta hydrolase [Pedobacter cryotolerans]|uniref:Alpha/beta hydrolase n=1 Tax=Pedobacter cryotolerans TaxID=2571270 RepID=A0A4U1C0U2_9SPHI|nr:alpha/beta hydrolase [Pedobacter cryotolerans]TKB97488.1 alpha/beta hydrolase [Pedobacter cryotolerans]